MTSQQTNESQSPDKDSKAQNISKSFIQESNDRSLLLEEKENQAETDEKLVSCKECHQLRVEMISKENEMQKKMTDLQQQMLKATETKSDSNHLEYLRSRLKDTMNEAKRHFNNYIQIR